MLSRLVRNSLIHFTLNPTIGPCLSKSFFRNYWTLMWAPSADVAPSFLNS